MALLFVPFHKILLIVKISPNFRDFVSDETMSIITHLNAVASALHHRSAPSLQQQFSLSQSPALTALVFDTSVEKGTLDIRRAITPIDINWAEALAQRWRAAVALWREGDIALACTNMAACVS
jgi:hypothetical protein